MKGSHLRTHHWMCVILCRWIALKKIFSTHARDFESYLKFLRNLENKYCTPIETRYFYFSNYFKNYKEYWKLWARVFNFYQVRFICKKVRCIRWCLTDFKLVKGLICSYKRLDFSVKINDSVKKYDFKFFLLLLSYRIGIKL